MPRAHVFRSFENDQRGDDASILSVEQQADFRGRDTFSVLYVLLCPPRTLGGRRTLRR
jgi:hypothetical protein